MRVYSLTKIAERYLPDANTFIMQPLTNANAEAIWNECFDKETKTFTIPEGYTHVFQFGFGPHASHIEKVIIPKSIKSIHEKALESCTKLKEITVSKENLYYFETLGMLCRRDNYKQLWIPAQNNPDELSETLIGNIFRLQKQVQLLEDRLLKYEEVIDWEELLPDEAVVSDTSAKEVVIFDNSNICIKISAVFLYSECMEIHIANSSPIQLFYSKTTVDSRTMTNLRLPKTIPYANNVRMKITGECNVDMDDPDGSELMIEMVDRNDEKLPGTELVYIRYSIKNKFYAIYKKQSGLPSVCVPMENIAENEFVAQDNEAIKDAVIYDDGEVVIKLQDTDIDYIQNSLLVKIWCKNFKYERTKLSIGMLAINGSSADNVRWGKSVEEFDVNTYDIKIPLNESDCGEVNLNFAVADINGKRLGYTKTISIIYITTVRIRNSKLAEGRKVVVEEKII